LAQGFDLNNQRREWSRPPIGGANTDSHVLDTMTNPQVREWVERNWPLQYGQPSSWQGKYRKALQLDETFDMRVLDYGAGFGFDALSYALNNNSVALADISPSNLRAATRVLLAMEFIPSEIIVVRDGWPHFNAQPFDIFHSSGVLHHTPYFREVLQRASMLLSPWGEIRLMLYTDHMWRLATGQEPPPMDVPPWTNSEFPRFVRFCDAVGDYADWYSVEKVNHFVGDFLTVTNWEYLREDNGYAVVTLKRSRL